MTDIIIIPAYQPDETLICLLEELHTCSQADILVINDGSSPDKNEIFRQAASYAMVLIHSRNQGKGQAIKTALSYIKEHFSDAGIVLADADGQHRTADILLLLRNCRKYPDTLILGVRSFHRRIPLRSRLGNEITRRVFHLMTGVALKDTQTGLRAFTSALIPRLLEIPGSRYEYETNMLMAFAREHLPIRQIPIETVYFEGNPSSHFRVLHDSVSIYGNMLKFISSSLVCFIVDYGLFQLILLLTGSLGYLHAPAISNIAARLVSAALNYRLNKSLVFRHQGDHVKTGLQYAALASGILLVNTCLLTYLLRLPGMSSWTAKFIVELTLFLFSYLIQQFKIFRI